MIHIMVRILHLKKKKSSITPEKESCSCSPFFPKLTIKSTGLKHDLKWLSRQNNFLTDRTEMYSSGCSLGVYLYCENWIMCCFSFCFVPLA